MRDPPVFASLDRQTGGWDPQDLPFNKQGAILSGAHRPLDQGDAAAGDFDAGDTPGMNAAPIVEIGAFARLGENRAMGVPGDDNLIFAGREGAQLFFNLFRFLAGAAAPYRRQEAHQLQRAPEIPHKEASQGPQGVVEQAALMAVNQQQALAGRRFSSTRLSGISRPGNSGLSQRSQSQ